jgi:hypothetical protein
MIGSAPITNEDFNILDYQVMHLFVSFFVFQILGVAADETVRWSGCCETDFGEKKLN